MKSISFANVILKMKKQKILICKIMSFFRPTLYDSQQKVYKRQNEALKKKSKIGKKQIVAKKQTKKHDTPKCTHSLNKLQKVASKKKFSCSF